uniref:DUF5647 family protein n=1 Tax=Thermus thermophilus TaxID=274 RepID=UPI000166000C|nr:DUF5647 family protein [Thermus thermophilus]
MVRNPMELRIGRLHGLFVEHLLRDPGLREALPHPFVLVALDPSDPELMAYALEAAKRSAGEGPMVYALFQGEELRLIAPEGPILPARAA